MIIEITLTMIAYGHLKGVKNNKEVMEVNLRSIYATRRYGLDHKGLWKICGVMNLSLPVTRKNDDNLSYKLIGAAAEFQRA